MIAALLELKSGLLATVGRVMTIPLGAQAMKIDLDNIKQAFEDKGYKVID